MLARLLCALRGHLPDMTEVLLAAPPVPPGKHLFYAYEPHRLRKCTRPHCSVFVSVERC